MAVTYTLTDRNKSFDGDTLYVDGTLALSGTYVTGGFNIVFTTVAVPTPKPIYIQIYSVAGTDLKAAGDIAYTYVWNNATQSVQILQGGTEIANGTNVGQYFGSPPTPNGDIVWYRAAFSRAF